MIKAFMDWTSVGVAAGALVKVLPAIAAVLSIVWMAIRIWESKTVQSWFGRDKTTQGDAVDPRSRHP